MKKIIYLFLIFISLNLQAEILECRMVQNMKVGIHIAKYKLEKLKSKNGTIYKKAGYNNRENYTIFSAITELGIETINLYDKPLNYEGVDVYNGHSKTVYKNGMIGEFDLLCYNFEQLNKKRVQQGILPTVSTVEDFKEK